HPFVVLSGRQLEHRSAELAFAAALRRPVEIAGGVQDQAAGRPGAVQTRSAHLETELIELEIRVTRPGLLELEDNTAIATAPTQGRAEQIPLGVPNQSSLRGRTLR